MAEGFADGEVYAMEGPGGVFQINVGRDAMINYLRNVYTSHLCLENIFGAMSPSWEGMIMT